METLEKEILAEVALNAFPFAIFRRKSFSKGKYSIQ